MHPESPDEKQNIKTRDGHRMSKKSGVFVTSSKLFRSVYGIKQGWNMNEVCHTCHMYTA